MKKLKNAEFARKPICVVFTCRHNIIDDFGEVILQAYDRFFALEKEIKELSRELKEINLPQRNLLRQDAN